MASGLARCRQQEKQREAFADLLKDLVDHLEARKPHSEKHSERVALTVGRLGQHLHLSLKEQGRLKLAAYLHDLGKIVIPEDILAKETPASELERYLLRQHALAGAKLMESVPFLKPLSGAIRHHHEHWDGSGYPDSLQGKNIPLYARIIGLADAYEHALRKYADLSGGKILETLRNSGYYDPELCTLLEKVSGYDRILS